MRLDQTKSQLYRLTQRMRRWLDESDLRTKYPDSLLVELCGEVFTEVVTDVMNWSQFKTVVQYQFSVVANTDVYPLPTNMGEVLAVRVIDTQGNIVGDLTKRSYINPFGWHWRIENGHFVFETAPNGTANYSIRVDYVPAGDVAMFAGTVPASALTQETINLSSLTATLGSVDRRPRAYLGCNINLYYVTNSGGSAKNPSGYSLTPIQERVIESVAPTTSIATFTRALDYDPSTALSGTDIVHVEVLPQEAPILWPTVELALAIRIMSMEARAEKRALLEAEFAKAKRALMMRIANANMRTGHSMAIDTPENLDYVGDKLQALWEYNT